MQILTLNAERLKEGVAFLAGVDADLAKIWGDLGIPPLWEREPGFSTLIFIILEQQVSMASAKAAYDRLLAVVSPLTPESFLRLDDDVLKKIGFSRQKAAYGRILAQAILNNELDLEELTAMPDEEVSACLTAIKGIGRWTADNYLLLALLRQDVFPATDLALQIAVQRVKNLTARPTTQEMENIAQAWRPWRSVATRLLWHHYLSK